MKNRIKIFLKHAFNYLIIFIFLVTLLSACKMIKSVTERFDNRMAEAVRSLDYAIDVLSQESANWQVTIANLEKELAKDIQSTIQHEITDLARNAVLSTGAEVRCNAEYMRIKVRRELIDIRNSYVISINAMLSNKNFVQYQIPLIPQEPVTPFICDIVPSAVDLSIDRERRTKIDIYGFDLRSMPIKASYKTYGEFQPKKLWEIADASFLSTMANRFWKHEVAVDLVVIDTLDAERVIAQPQEAIAKPLRENLYAESFSLLQPWVLFDYDVSHAISIISDFHAVLDLSGSGANLPPNAKEVLLSWNDKIQCEIPVITYEKVLECITKDTSVVLKPVTFIPEAVLSSPYGGNPDLEFKGYGPCIEFSMSIHIDPSKKSVIADLFMDAWECDDDLTTIHPDYTQAVERKSVVLFKIDDPNTTIEKINMGTGIYEKFIDTSTNPMTINYGSYSAVSKIEFVGDTSGDEAGSETGATISFNKLNIKIQRCEYK